MRHRRVKLVLLCEDRQHEAFACRFFEKIGWHRRAIRVEKSPQGRGSGEQWVRQRFPQELKALRSSHVTALLVAIVDADRSTVTERLRAFEDACSAADVPPRGPQDSATILIPRRNIETWFAYLQGKSVDESSPYPRLARPRACAGLVQSLKEMCDAGQLREPAPPSLQKACEEYEIRIKSFGR